MSAGRHVVVVGGGISGLAAAHRICRLAAADPPRVSVLEAEQRLGGKIRTEVFAGRPFDAGAEALLTRVPEAVALCRELGLEHALVAPASDQAYLWTRGGLRPLPRQMMAGAPGGASSVASTGILSHLGLARAGLDLLLPSRPPDHDVSIGQLVRRRLGHEVLERLVDPLLGGIHAGSCDELSVRATAPQLVAALRSHRGLVRGLRAAAAGSSATPGPTFLSLSGGLGELVRVLRSRLDGAEVRTGTAVETLEALPEGRTRLLLAGDEQLVADHVVLAVPAHAAVGILEQACAPAAHELQTIDYASVATVLLSYPLEALADPLPGTGFLVPRTERRTLTACTWASAKWPHLAGETMLFKASVGRAGDRRALDLTDEQIAGHVHAELVEAMGLRRQPLDVRVVRFECALPQYHVGHLERIARVESALRELPGVHLAGAAFHGVGVGACIRDGEAAAARIAAELSLTAMPSVEITT